MTKGQAQPQQAPQAQQPRPVQPDYEGPERRTAAPPAPRAQQRPPQAAPPAKDGQLKFDQGPRARATGDGVVSTRHNQRQQ